MVEDRWGQLWVSLRVGGGRSWKTGIVSPILGSRSRAARERGASKRRRSWSKAVEGGDTGVDFALDGLDLVGQGGGFVAGGGELFQVGARGAAGKLVRCERLRLFQWVDQRRQLEGEFHGVGAGVVAGGLGCGRMDKQVSSIRRSITGAASSKQMARLTADSSSSTAKMASSISGR